MVRIRRQFSAIAEQIDYWVGRFVTLLREAGALDETLVVFTADHGEMLGDRGFFMKNAFYDPAINVPLVVRGPGVAKGAVSDALVELYDVPATFLELAGATFPIAVAARSIEATLVDGEGTPRDDVVSERFYGRTIIDNDYKFVFNHNDRPELYDRREDPLELHNLAAERPDVVGSLYDRLRNRLR